MVTRRRTSRQAPSVFVPPSFFSLSPPTGALGSPPPKDWSSERLSAAIRFLIPPQFFARMALPQVPGPPGPQIFFSVLCFFVPNTVRRLNFQISVSSLCLYVSSLFFDILVSLEIFGLGTIAPPLLPAVPFLRFSEPGFCFETGLERFPAAW